MKTIDVFGVSYLVLEKCNIDSDGVCNPIKKTIQLKKTTRDKETLCHEIGHAIIFEAGVYCAISEDIQEVIVQHHQHFAISCKQPLINNSNSNSNNNINT